MLPDSHRQEALSRAFITAIAAKAGVKCILNPNDDVGIDGQFKLVKALTTLRPRKLTKKQLAQVPPPDTVPLVKLREFGLALDFQLKSTTSKCKIGDRNVSYEAEADDYDKLVDPERATPILLIVCALPKEPDWLAVDHDHTRLGGRCFYHFEVGSLTSNSGSKTITIPRTNLLSAISLKTVIQDYHDQYVVTQSLGRDDAESN